MAGENGAGDVEPKHSNMGLCGVTSRGSVVQIQQEMQKPVIAEHPAHFQPYMMGLEFSKGD